MDRAKSGQTTFMGVCFFFWAFFVARTLVCLFYVRCALDKSSEPKDHEPDAKQSPNSGGRQGRQRPNMTESVPSSNDVLPFHPRSPNSTKHKLLQKCSIWRCETVFPDILAATT